MRRDVSCDGVPLAFATVTGAQLSMAMHLPMSCLGVSLWFSP
jgi:hypothetical protein